LRINGEVQEVFVDESTPLLFILRNFFRLTGAKLGCGLEQCGACMVLVDGTATPSCVRPLSEFEHKEIVTVEGLAHGGALTPIQLALAREGAAQCGYCLPGIVVKLTELFSPATLPDIADIRRGLDENICRCGTHPAILRAARRLISERSGGN
jgi:nicotinate dehydrogenase subunit A